MSRAVPPPVPLNFLAAGIAGGLALLLPFAIAGIRESSAGWPWGSSLLVGWSAIGLFGATAYRARPAPKSRGGFSFWFTLLLLPWLGISWLFVSLAGGAPAAAWDSGWGLFARVFFLALADVVPALLLLGVSERGSELFVFAATFPLLGPVAFVLLAIAEQSLL